MAAKHRSGTTLRQWVLRRWTPYALFALVTALAVSATWYVSITTNARIKATQLTSEARFFAEADKTRQQIQVRLNTNIEIIRAGAALLAASNEISHLEFRTFVAGLQLQERYPGMEAIGFAPRVRAEELQAFRRAVDLDGIHNLRLWRPPAQLEYHPVLFLESRNGSSLATTTYEISADPIIREAMEHARDTGQPAASGKLSAESPFNRNGKAMFVVLVPVYRIGLPVDSDAARRQALFGFVFSPFNASELLQHIAANTSTPISFEVYDGRHASSVTLLGGHARTTTPVTIRSPEVVNVAGRDWLAVVSSAEPVITSGSRAAMTTLAVGLLLSLLLFLTMRAQVRAWETAVRHQTELLASQQALRASEALAQAADRAKDEFLATLSHELRTPLNTILGWVTMLRDGSVRSERQAHALAVIERNAHLQSELIEDLLDISRIVTGKLRLRLRSVSVTPIVAAAVESLRPSAEAKGVELHGPSTSESFVARADPQRLQQIVWNLVSNAIKFTSQPGRIDVELSKDDRQIHLSVRDTGIGIAPEFLPHVFERFLQADSSTTRPHSGLGLGLSIVRHLVELHGATIEALSGGLNRGAQFLVHFPLAASPSGELPVAVSGRNVRPSAVLEGVRILLVDDDPGTRDLLSEALSLAGAAVRSAESASEAIQLLTTEGADVLISDIGMPGEDGLSLMRKVRAIAGPTAQIPAVALTALARVDDRERALEAGYQLFLAKPIDLTELQTCLAELLGRLDVSTA
jgi:signal transduction histidine kinase/ActR/RegA family two-component response regulator